MNGLPDELTTTSTDSEVSGADPAGAMQVSSVGIRAVEQVLAIINSLRAFPQIQQSCNSLKEDWMIYQQYFRSAQVLVRSSGLNLPREVGYAVNWTLAENKDLTVDDIKILRNLKPLLNEAELDDRTTEIHAASKYAELNARDEDGNTPAMIALSLNNLPVLQALFEAGASLHFTNDHSQNILYFAARYTDASVLEYLNSLELEGINPELPDKSGDTPKDNLRWAMRTEDSELVSPLRRPCPATWTAFTQLYFGVQTRNLENDLNTLRQLRHSVEQSDWDASCIKLSTLISWKETCSQHRQVWQYQRILRVIEDGRRWDLAMKQIQIDVQDTICRLEFAQSVLAGFVDPFSGNTVQTEEIDEDLDTEPEGHSCCPTHQEPEGSGLSVETMVLVSTLPDLINLVFDKVPSFFEPPVPAGKTRVRWKCGCGDDLFDDFTETTPGSLDALRARLSDLNRTHNFGQKQGSSELQLVSSLGSWMKQTMCICLPPVARIESNEYRCAPAPKAELGYFPALGPRELLHYFKKPHDFEIPQRSYLNQIPKRACGQLRAAQDQAELGWGLHFEEGWHWKTIYFVMVALVAVLAMVFGIVWLVVKEDI
ncbi:hypothetical protein CDV31_009252 [Fusarium ambrosium]|uniref:Uncharacterized protein n=1 Tax=Fusarium ambrosium TaxID=131363 RepID=A0A428TVU6_9HYPO|nr:hypothetical protein CDV31_009252 [Fusarium ambrosium]